MPLSKEIERQAKNDIYESIILLIERYLSDGVDIYDIEKYFKMKKPFITLLSDINYVGRRYFDDNEDYYGFVKKILNQCISDKKSEHETKSLSEKNIKKFNNFLNESNDQSNLLENEEMTIEYLFNDLDYSEDDKDILAEFFKTNVEYIESKEPKYSVYSIKDFHSDILPNNRVSFNALILSNIQLQKMKENITKKVISGIFSQIPDVIDYMGIRVRPHTLMDKTKLKESIEKLIDEQQVIDLVTKLTKYTFVNKHGDYCIWKKN